MYQKIKNSLFYPRELATSYKESVIGFIIFLIVCTSLPFILHICVNGIITSTDVRNTKLAFYESTLVDYKIEDHKLVPYEENTPNRFIKFSENRIDLNDIILIDTLGHTAIAKGIITHDYLKDFVFDIDATLDNFLGMNMLGEGNSSFYGTAIANGDLKIDGPLDDIVMNINAYTMPGTVLDIRLVNTSSINDNFIIFHILRLQSSRGLHRKAS